jgi:hypothetical protein
MNRSAASEVLLVRAFETAGAADWGEADRAWASQAALKQVGADAPAESFIAARAHAALQRLATREPALKHWRAAPPWRGEWLLLALTAGLIAGLLIDQVGSAQRINLLAPPVWAVIAWNLLVYAALFGQRLFGGGAPGALRRALSRWLRRMRSRGFDGGGSAAVWQAFAADWAKHSAPLAGVRLAQLLHAAAAARALGCYRRLLDESFVMKDLRTFQRAPELLEIDRLYDEYPEVICDFMDRMYRVDGSPKESLLRMGLAMARAKVGARTLVRDAWTTWRTI